MRLEKCRPNLDASAGSASVCPAALVIISRFFRERVGGRVNFCRSSISRLPGWGRGGGGGGGQGGLSGSLGLCHAGGVGVDYVPRSRHSERISATQSSCQHVHCNNCNHRLRFTRGMSLTLTPLGHQLTQAWCIHSHYQRPIAQTLRVSHHGFSHIAPLEHIDLKPAAVTEQNAHGMITRQ